MASTRRPDKIEIEALDGGGAFDRFTSLEITNDLLSPASASFEIGDDGTWQSVEDRIKPGSRYEVRVNGRLRLTGRVDSDDVPVDAEAGATVRFVVRTKLADAAYASAKPTLSLVNATLKDVITRAYGPHGFKDNDFLFQADVSRDLMTGKSSRSGDTPADLDAIDLQQAKVNPPETVYEFAERHLNRFHLSHWDAPDGRIVVGVPNDLQDPICSLQLLKGRAGRANNLLTARRVRDFSDAPSELRVTGLGGKWDFANAAITHRIAVPQLEGFYRPIAIVDESIRTSAQARARAMREVTARVKKIDAWEVATDGWSFWDGTSSTPFGIDTVASVNVDVGGGATGPYLLHRVVCRIDPESGQTVQLSLLRRGLWRI